MEPSRKPRSTLARSIRRIASQPTLATPALQCILVADGRTDSDILGYFKVKKTHGLEAVPKPILNGDVVSALKTLGETNTNAKVTVQILVICFEEFSSNSEVLVPWTEFSEDISHLLYVCLDFISKTYRPGSIQNTDKLEERLRVLFKLCRVLTSVSGKSESLSTALFNKCAVKLLTLLMVKDITSHVQEAILLAVSNLCQHACRSGISEVFRRLDTLLKYVARMIMDFPIETQMSIYNILSKSLTGEEEAVQKAPIWFHKWPPLQNTFIESTSKDFPEGCGPFLDKLYELGTKSTLNKKQSANNSKVNEAVRSGKYCTISHAGNNSTSNPKTAPKTALCELLELGTPYGGIKASGGRSVLNTAGVLKPAVELVEKENSKESKPSVDLNIKVSCDSKQRPNEKKFQTPYYPDGRKSLSFLKQTEDPKTARETVLCESVDFEIPYCGTKASGRHIVANTGAGVKSGVGLLEKENPKKSIKPTVDLTTKVCSDSKQPNKNIFQTPYYLDGRKSLSIRKQTEVNQVHSNKNGPVQPKLSFCKKEDFEHFDISPRNKIFCQENKSKGKSYPILQGKKEAGTLKQNSLLSLHHEEDHSSKVERWLSGHVDAECNDVEVLDQTRTKLKLNNQDEQRKVTAHKRLTSGTHDAPKRRREDTPAIDDDSAGHLKRADVHHDSVRGCKSELQTLVESSDDEMNEDISVVFEKGSKVPGSEHPGSKRKLSSKSTDKEVIASHRKESEKNIPVPLKGTSSNRDQNEERSWEQFVSNTNHKQGHWGQKLLNLDKTQGSEGHSHDMFCFHMNTSEDIFKIPSRAVTKKRPAGKNSVQMPKASKSALFGKGKPSSMNKENECPKAGYYEPFLKKELGFCQVKEVVEILKKTPREVKHHGANTGLRQDRHLDMTPSGNNRTANKSKSEKIAEFTPHPKKEEKKARLEFYSPIQDDSMESVKPESVHQATNARMSSTKQNCHFSSSLKPALPNESIKPITTSSCAQKSGLSMQKVNAIHRDVPKVQTSNVGSSHRLPIHGNTKQIDSTISSSLNSGLRRNVKTRELDSGIEASASEVLSSSSKEGIMKKARQDSAHTLYLKMRLRKSLEQSKDANSTMMAHQNTMSHEIKEIQGLAEKITESVSRCQTASTANHQTLGKQATSLATCSKYLGPDEDQSFKALVPATKMIDYKEYYRKMRDQNTERMMKAIKTVLDNDYPLSATSSDSE